MGQPDFDEEAIFTAARELADADAIHAYLDTACAGNIALRGRVERLLGLAGQAQDFFQFQAVQAVPVAAALDGQATVSISPEARDPSGLPRLGDYQLIEEVARGGMGVVYKARQVSLDRLVAVKTLLLGPLAGKDFVQRFRVEASAAASLRHPNIVAVHEVGVQGNQHYLVMDYIAGQTLAKISGGQPLAPRRAAAYVKTIAEAVHYAHERGVLHRDLKPSNVLVDQNDQPHVTDFGLAKRLDTDSDLTLSGQVLGSPNYMSPEQAGGKRGQVGRASDVYSLGAILFHLLTGRPPFVAESVSDTIQLVLEREPITPRVLVMGIPRDLETICLKCLRKEPDKRYQTAQELAHELERFLQDEPIRARRATQPEKLWRWCRRRPAMASLAAATITLLLAVTIGSPIAIYRISRERTRVEASELKLQRNLYVAKINLIQQAWDQNNLARLRQLLDDTAAYPDRGFEWYYWQRQAHLELRTFRGHQRVVSSVAYSPDGQRIATASWDSTAKVWDMASGEELFTLTGHTDFLNAVAFSPDGQRIITGSRDGTARVWDAAKGKYCFSLTRLNPGDQISSVAFSPDGQRIVIGIGTRESVDMAGRATVWDATNGQLLHTLQADSSKILATAFSPDGTRIATGSKEGSVIIWDALTGTELIRLDGHRGRVESVAFSPDGRQLVTASTDRTAKVWELSSGRERLSLNGHANELYCARFSRDGHYIATGSFDQTAKLWDSASGEELTTFKGHQAGILSVAFSPDGQHLVSAGGDWMTNAENAARLWRLDLDTEMVTFRAHKAAVLAGTFSRDGRTAFTGGKDKTAKAWNAISGRELATLGCSSNVMAIAASSNGKLIVTGCEDGLAHVWEANEGRHLLTLRGHTELIHGVAFSPDNRQIATASHDGTGRIWNSATGEKMLELRGQEGRVWSVDFSPNGQELALASDRSASVWNVAAGRRLLVLSGHADLVFVAIFSPNGQRILTASADRTARIWEASSGKLLQSLIGHGDQIWAAAFSPDSSRVVTGGADMTARLWDAECGQELLAFRRHSGEVRSVAISSDGQRILTTSFDQTARVWQSASNEQLTAWRRDVHPSAK